MGMNFRVDQSGGCTGPDTPENGYTGRILADGKNTGEGVALCG
jgi:hypothetical protein